MRPRLSVQAGEYLRRHGIIHRAEEAGLISRIGDWVFTEAATAALRLGNVLGTPFQTSTNKSPLELPSPDHLPRLDWLAVLQRMGLDPRRIVIEITEGLLLHATPNVTERISTLARRMHLAAQAAARKG